MKFHTIRAMPNGQVVGIILHVAATSHQLTFAASHRYALLKWVHFASKFSLCRAAVGWQGSVVLFSVVFSYLPFGLFFQLRCFAFVFRTSLPVDNYSFWSFLCAQLYSALLLRLYYYYYLKILLLLCVLFALLIVIKAVLLLLVFLLQHVVVVIGRSTRCSAKWNYGTVVRVFMQYRHANKHMGTYIH